MLRTHRQFFIYALLLSLFSQQLYAEEYKIAVRAHNGIEKAIIQWQATIELLNQQLPQHRFVLHPILSLDEITQRVGEDEFEFFLTNPSSFVEIRHRHQAEALATLNNKRAGTAQDHFGSVIFTHVRNKDILSIDDLKNKSLMVVSEPAFGGWRVAWLEMLKQGFDPYKRLGELKFTESRAQPDVVRAVIEGHADAGVVRTDLLERMEQNAEVDLRYLRIINNKNVSDFPFFLSTELYPEWAFAATRTAPADLKQQIQKILLEQKPDSEAAKKGQYIGWIPADDYSSVDKLMQQLKVGIYEQP